MTDSAAAATAFATGKKTNNGHVGVLPSGESVTSILDYAENNGLATGLVATSQIAHATPASFFGHHTNRAKMQELAAQLVEKDIDLIIGGGQNHFENRLIIEILAKN